MLKKWVGMTRDREIKENMFSVEALTYCYSAIFSRLDFGVIQYKEKEILELTSYLLNVGGVHIPSVCKKYSIICL